MAGMTGAQYNLILSAQIKDGTVQASLEKLKDKMRSTGTDVLDLKVTLDKEGNLQKYTQKWATAAGEVTSQTGKMVKAYGEVDGKMKLMGTTLQETTTISKNAKREAKELAAEQKALAASAEDVGKKTGGLASSMLQSIKTAAIYALSIGLVYKALREVGEGVQYIKDLDKEMRNIQIVAGYTDEQIKSLAGDYNILAKELGATTLEVASGSLEWTRQGKSIAETQELLRSTLMLSKLGNVEAAEATEYLTSVLNGFKLEAKDAEGVVDKLVAVDNAAATSTQELATAMQKSSVSAQAAGVDLNTLIAYIGTVSSITRLSAETVGTSLIF